MSCLSTGGRNPIAWAAFILKFESLGQGLLGAAPAPHLPHGRSLPMVLSHFDREQLRRSRRLRLRRPQDSEPPRGGHVCPGDGLLRPRGYVCGTAPYFHLELLRLEQRACGDRTVVLLFPHASGRLHRLVHRTILPRIRTDAATRRAPAPAGL